MFFKIVFKWLLGRENSYNKVWEQGKDSYKYLPKYSLLNTCLHYSYLAKQKSVKKEIRSLVLFSGGKKKTK